MGDKAVLMAAVAVGAGVAALASLVCAGPLTLARMGLTVPQQLAAQRVLTCGILAALLALPFGVAFFARRLPPCAGSSKCARFLKMAALVVLPVVLTLATLNTPFWSAPSPDAWNRPRYIYGWPLPWKNDAGMVAVLFMPCVNWVLWAAYFWWLLGCCRNRSGRDLIDVRAVQDVAGVGQISTAAHN